MRLAAIVLLGLLAGACNATPPDWTPPEGAPPEASGPIPKHETFLRNPTAIRADSVRVILPASYSTKLEVSGLSDGWKSDAELRVWEGTGDCRLALLLLHIRCGELSVTLVNREQEPEVVVQARGNVDMEHVVRGVVTRSDGVTLLMLRNEKRFER